MGRWDTGAIATGESLQLSIKAFSKSLKEKLYGEGGINWESGASISFDL